MDRVRGVCFAGLSAGMTLLSTPAFSQAIDVSTSATVTSDYRFRGISQSDRDPALQASIDVKTPVGFFAGGFASSVDGRLLGGADAEIDLYAGYETSSGGFRYALSGFGYFYPGGHGASYGEVQGDLGYQLGPAEAKVFAAYAPDQRNTGGDDLYLGAGLSSAIPATPFFAALKAGYEDGFFNRKWDWQAELSYVRGPFTASAAYVDTNQDGRTPIGRLGGAGGIASLSVAF